MIQSLGSILQERKNNYNKGFQALYHRIYKYDVTAHPEKRENTNAVVKWTRMHAIMKSGDTLIFHHSLF
jgi:hypothetical protein